MRINWIGGLATILGLLVLFMVFVGIPLIKGWI